MRAAWVEVDLDAIESNVAILKRHCRPAELCAVVKADGYGHGGVAVAQAAVRAGASTLAVALVDEGIQLREAGLEEQILVLSEPPVNEMVGLVAAGLTPTLYSRDGVVAAGRAARDARVNLPVHLKVDTGMGRVGALPEDAVGVAELIDVESNLTLEGLFTHCAVADDPGDPFTDEQLQRFAEVRQSLDERNLLPGVLHVANSSAAISRPESRFDLVRCGISIYGLEPSPLIGNPLGLRAALSVRARVSHVKRLPAGEALSYGRHYLLDHESVIATVPIGYADGVRRGLATTGGEVLISGERLPIAGSVTMDQIVVDCGPDSEVAVGDEVVLLGSQGDEQIRAEEWAERLGTITYEVVCGFSGRLPRIHQGRTNP